jgi:hypothetical protein
MARATPHIWRALEPSAAHHIMRAVDDLDIGVRRASIPCGAALAQNPSRPE